MVSFREFHDGEEREGGAAPGDGARADSSRPGFEAIAELGTRLKEAAAHLSHLLTARVDRAALSARKGITLAALGAIGLFAGLAMAATLAAMLSIFLLRGMAGGLGALFGGRPWLGELVLGALFFGALAFGLVWGLRKARRSFQEKLVEKYEKRKRAQREQFGRTVEDQARAAREE